MKRVLFAVAVGAVAGVFAAESAAKAPEKETKEVQPAAKASEAEAKDAPPAAQLEEKNDVPLFWGFGNTGIYSGYQLYGSLVNSEPTWQTYLEANMNLVFGDWDLGYAGVGFWGNSDLTDKRHNSYGKWFNEQDYNVHWGRTFWFDDERRYGLDYRTSVVWYYYPHHRGHNVGWGSVSTSTTMDWNHYFEFKNPFVNPFINAVHEYHESDGNLLEFGLKRTCGVTEKFSLTPAATFVWRNSHYNWCFPTHFGADAACNHGSGIATMKLGVDANYQLFDHFGLFAKVAYCSVIDPDLRDNIDGPISGADYGDYKDFAWGGCGITVNF